MKRKALFLFAVIFGLSAAHSALRAQEFGVRRAISSVSSQNSSTPVRTRTVTVQKVRTVTKEVVRSVSVKTSNLTVSTEEGATVALEPEAKGGKPRSLVVPEDRTIEFENLPPGTYTVTASLDGYQSQETEVVVVPQKTLGITLDLEAVTYQLDINTNVNGGEVRYAPAELIKTNADGSLETKESGGYCIVPIVNGKASIKELRKGYYNIDIRPSAVEYQKTLAAISVPKDILAAEGTAKSYRIDLDKKESTEIFSSAWTNADWVLPANWSLQENRLKTGGIGGMALPRSEQYRYYINFEMKSDVRSLDGGTIGFVFRALDDKNYYLAQLAGANAAEPLRLKFFVVKDGKANQLPSISIEPFASTIKASKSFRMIIKGTDNTFKFFIEDSETGDTLPLGDVIDRDKNFQKGAIGINAQQNANFEVGNFIVCPGKCR